MKKSLSSWFSIIIRQWKEYFIIRKSGYFDPAYYLLHNPDVRKADVDPLWHFIKSGWLEGRNPCNWFDLNHYLESNSDVKGSGLNPFVHYLQYGYREGRLSNSIFIQVSPKIIRSPGALSQRIMISFKLRENLFRLGVFIFRRVPDKFRWQWLSWLYRHFGFLFKGLPHYENWRKSKVYIPYSTPEDLYLVNLDNVQPARSVHGSIAIHLHIFYSDFIKESANLLKNMPFPYDLYISTPEKEIAQRCETFYRDLPELHKLTIRLVQNRGRNFAPLFCTFGAELSRYDFIAHLHSKKSLYNRGATKGWREYLIEGLLGSEQQIRKIFALLQDAEPRGIVYPQNYHLLPYWANTWLANDHLARVWCARVGISNIPRGYFDFPAGSMFWARATALAPIFDARITLDDFPEEAGQTDGTLAHTLERLLVICSLERGLKPAIIKDHIHPSWSPWRLDQYISRPSASLAEMMMDPSIKLIAFDIFDTLILRPLLNPQTVKDIVAKKIDSPIGDLYRQYRDLAEHQARARKGRDVGIEEIFKNLREIADLSDDTCSMLMNLEETVELSLMQARPSGIELYHQALATGKPVCLVSDMFLPKKVIETGLEKIGISDWHSIYLSSELGVRKDNNGELYKYILDLHKIKSSEMLMIGDNERSDVQIPCDMGMHFIHLMRPVEIARGLPRLAHIINGHEIYQGEDRIDDEIRLALILNKNYASLALNNLDIESIMIPEPYYLGYSLVGPLVLSFVDWLVEKATEDNIDHFYFLSREGKLLKLIYDEWCRERNDLPPSDYLVISRRAASVAAIESMEDILTIAKTEYYPNTIENFLYTRYGLTLPKEKWDYLSDTLDWDSTDLVKVQDEDIRQLTPLLRELAEDIISRARQEKEGLLRYLFSFGIDRNANPAVVDIGYGGSVQKYLNRILEHKIHGYYLITSENAQKVAEEYKVIAQGCFYENLKKSSNLPVLYKLSFYLEKMMSYNEPQVQFYSFLENNSISAIYREVSEEEERSRNVQESIHLGALDFVKDGRQVFFSMGDGFRPSRKMSVLLMEEFLNNLSLQERQILANTVIDDYYCGRGLVR